MEVDDVRKHGFAGSNTARRYGEGVKIKSEEDGTVLESCYTDSEGKVWETVSIKEEMSDDEYEEVERGCADCHLPIKQEVEEQDEESAGVLPGQVIHTGQIANNIVSDFHFFLIFKNESSL